MAKTRRLKTAGVFVVPNIGGECRHYGAKIHRPSGGHFIIFCSGCSEKSSFAEFKDEHGHLSEVYARCGSRIMIKENQKVFGHW